MKETARGRWLNGARKDRLYETLFFAQQIVTLHLHMVLRVDLSVK